MLVITLDVFQSLLNNMAIPLTLVAFAILPSIVRKLNLY